MTGRGPVPVLLAGFLALLLGGARAHNREGNALYGQKRYPEALEEYAAAQAEAPDSPEVRYNLGNVLYRMNRAAEAARLYDSVRLREGGPRREAAYNAGNAAYRLQQYPVALARYTEALLADPSDADARRNLELTLRRMREAQSQQQQQEPQDQPQDQPQPPGEQPPPQPPDTEGQPPPTPEEMTRQQAQRILDSLEEQEAKALREAQREENEGQGSSRYGDW